jgi:hypothetical protein
MREREREGKEGGEDGKDEKEGDVTCSNSDKCL